MEPRLTARRGAGAAAVAMAVLGACSIQEHQPPGERPTAGADTTAVLAELQQYYRDFSARDWDAFSGHFWPGADITTAWQTPGDSAARVAITPVPEFVARAPEGPDSRAIFEESMLGAEIRVNGDLAQAWVRYRARFGDAGDVMEWEGTDAFLLMRLDGVWKIVELAFSPDG